MKFLFLLFSFLPLALFSQQMKVEEEDIVELAFAQRIPMLNEMIDKLGLSQDLKTKIEDLWYQHQKQMLDIRYQIEKKEIEMMDILRKDDFSIDKFQAKWKEIQQLRNDKELKVLNFKISVYKLLPKEKAKEVRQWLFSDKDGMRKKIIRKVMEKVQEHKCTEEQKREHKCKEHEKK